MKAVQEPSQLPEERNPRPLIGIAGTSRMVIPSKHEAWLFSYLGGGLKLPLLKNPQKHSVLTTEKLQDFLEVGAWKLKQPYLEHVSHGK
jgi:hypothetical protein